MSTITLLLTAITLGPVAGSTSERDSVEELATTAGANAGSVLRCRWPGDLDGSGGVPDLKDFAVLQRCLGLSAPAVGCSLNEFRAADLQTDGVIDLHDYAVFTALGWPPPMTINCGLCGSYWCERCGPGCLPDGDAVETGAPVIVAPHGCQPANGFGMRRIRVAKDADALEALVDPTPLGHVDFESSEVIIFTTPGAVEHGCWETVHCYSGTMDLPDGRRAAIVGFVEHGPLICCALPWPVTRALVAPRSDRPVVLLFIEQDGHVTQILAPSCERGSERGKPRRALSSRFPPG